MGLVYLLALLWLEWVRIFGFVQLFRHVNICLYTDTGLQDHPYFGIGYRINVTSDQQLANPSYLQQSRADFVQRQDGPLTNIGADLIGTTV